MNNLTQLDSFPVTDLVERYGVARSNIYNRLEGLNIKPEKLGKKAVINADQLALMDQLNEHLKAGETIATFNSPIGHVEKSYETTGQTLIKSKPSEMTVTAQQLLGVLETISQALAVPPPQIPTSSPHPLENIRRIQEAHDRQWRLSTSQLAPLLGVKSLSGSEVRRFGFVFKREGKNGAESAWRISKDV